MLQIIWFWKREFPDLLAGHFISSFLELGDRTNEALSCDSPVVESITLEPPTFTPFAPTTPDTPDLSTPVTDGIADFEVQAGVWKNVTGISVTAGDLIHIEYKSGQWTGDNSQPGLMEGCGFTWYDPQTDRVWLFPPEQRGTALVGYVDNELFLIGCQPIDIVTPISSELFLSMSDCLGCYEDNDGKLYVSISVNRQ